MLAGQPLHLRFILGIAAYCAFNSMFCFLRVEILNLIEYGALRLDES